MPAARPLLTQRIAFAVWSWIAVATALVCALVPAGLPSTRAIGSAFDPSTTIVALRSTSPATRAAARIEDDGDDKRRADIPAETWHHPAASPAALPAPSFAVAPLPPVGAAPIALRPAAPDPLRYARPPPIR